MKRNGKKLGIGGTILVIIVYLLLVKMGVIQMDGAGNAGDNNVASNNTPAPIETEAPTEAPKPTKAPEVTEAPKPTKAPEATQAPTEEPQVDEEEEIELTNYWFRTKALRDSHFEKHGIEMGFETPEEYIKAANMVICNPEALHKLEAEDGDHIYFLEETNEFVVLSQDGYIRTYYIANGGIDYFNRQ